MFTTFRLASSAFTPMTPASVETPSTISYPSSAALYGPPLSAIWAMPIGVTLGSPALTAARNGVRSSKELTFVRSRWYLSARSLRTRGPIGRVQGCWLNAVDLALDLGGLPGLDRHARVRLRGVRLEKTVEGFEGALRHVHVVVVDPGHRVDDVLHIARGHGQLLLLVVGAEVDRVELDRHAVLGLQDLVHRVLHQGHIRHWREGRIRVGDLGRGGRARLREPVAGRQQWPGGRDRPSGDDRLPTLDQELPTRKCLGHRSLLYKIGRAHV